MDDRFRQMGDRIRESVYNRVDHILNGGNRQPMYPATPHNRMGDGQSTQGGQYNGSGGNYTPWSGMPNGGHYNEGQRHTQYQPYPQNTMGFNPNQNTGPHQYGIPQQHEQGGYDKHEHVRQYMRDICSGKEQMPPELMQMMCMAAAEAVQEYMGNGQGGSMQRYSAGEYSDDSQKDKEFKETIEKIRKTQNHQEKMRMIAEYFPRVQQGTLDYKVLVDLVTKVPSIEQRAGALQIKPEQYREIKSNLKNMRN